MNLRTAFFRAYRYLIYWLFKVDEHALQAPYIFSLFKNVLKSGNSDYESDIKLLVKTFRDHKDYFSNHEGAGSVIDTKSYSISKIAKRGLTSPKYSYLFQRILKSIEAKKALELGTSLGINSAVMARSEGLEKLITVEKNQDLAQIAQSNFDQLDLNQQIELMCMSVEDALVVLTERKEQFDLIYVDANHTYEATISYYTCLNKMISQDQGFIIFDDVNWSKGMRRAWEEIKISFDRGLVLENYQMGILIYNRDLRPKEYILNF